MPQARQQGLDAHQPQQQVPIGQLRQLDQIQPGAEVPPGAAQHQRMQLGVATGRIHRVDQRLHESGPERVAELRPVQQQGLHAVGALRLQHACTGVRAIAERSHRLGTTVLS
jgi:hypothetical protein